MLTHRLNHWDLQTLTTKLDSAAITLSFAKKYAANMGFHSSAKTKDAFLRELARSIREQSTPRLSDIELFSLMAE